MKDIFKDGIIVDDNNFLDHDPKKLKKLNSVAEFQEAIVRLQNIRDNLMVARKIERLQTIGNRAYYIDAINWLKGLVALQSWHHVPQISDVSSITQDIAAAFNLYTQQLQQNLQAEPSYAQIETTMVVSPVTKSMPLTKTIQTALDSAESRIGKEVSSAVADLIDQHDKSIQNIQKSARSIHDGFSSQIQDRQNQAYMDIDARVQQAGAQLQAAVQLRDWGTEYDGTIAELSIRLHGLDSSDLVRRNFEALIRKFKGLRSVGRKNIRWLPLLGKILYLLVKNTISVVGIIWSKLLSLAARRTVAFLGLLATAGTMVALPLLAMFGLLHAQLYDTVDPVNFLAKTVLWLPAVVVLSVGYSFTTKNYRIYANMLDQYKHRRSVAKTAQGIILNVDSSGENKEFRAAMTAAAATALFEHKVTGHLSKKEVESMGMLDLFKALR